MGLRKASAYSKRKFVPYTRVSKRKGKSYVKTVPQQKIVKFTMGNKDLSEKGKLPHKLTIISEEKCQMRHNALEACRQYMNKQLDKKFAGQYLFKVVPFPHHIQRENKMLTGAGADRMQTGMQLAFGKSSSKAAILKDGSKIFIIEVPDEQGVMFARSVIRKMKPKIPCKIKVLHEKKK